MDGISLCCLRVSETCLELAYVCRRHPPLSGYCTPVHGLVILNSEELLERRHDETLRMAS